MGPTAPVPGVFTCMEQVSCVTTPGANTVSTWVQMRMTSEALLPLIFMDSRRLRAGQLLLLAALFGLWAGD